MSIPLAFGVLWLGGARLLTLAAFCGLAMDIFGAHTFGQQAAIYLLACLCVRRLRGLVYADDFYWPSIFAALIHVLVLFFGRLALLLSKLRSQTPFSESDLVILPLFTALLCLFAFTAPVYILQGKAPQLASRIRRPE